MKYRPEQPIVEMRYLREALKNREEALEILKESLKKEILENPVDSVIDRNFIFIDNAEEEIKAIWKISNNLKFEIEDITGEVEDA